MKYFAILLLCVALLACVPQAAFADTLDDLENQVEEGLGNLDLSEVEEVSRPFLGSFVEKVKQIINGELDSAESFFEVLLSMTGSTVSQIFPQLAAIFCVLVICGVARHTSDGLISGETEKVISFVGITVVVISVLSLVVDAYRQVQTMLSQVAALTDASMPILLTLVIANGGNAASAVCQPSMVIYSSFVINIVQGVLLPLSVFGLAFVVVSNISSDLRVTKMADFVNSASSWILGIVFTLFSAFTAVQGITAATVDGVSYRAAKFAAKNYIPILGGYISEGFDIVVASTSLIKNAFGAVGMLVVFFMALQPLVTLLCVNLGLQALSAVSEPIVEERYIRLLSGISKSLTFLAVLVVAVAFMFCILAIVAISCANGV